MRLSCTIAGSRLVNLSSTASRKMFLQSYLVGVIIAFASWYAIYTWKRWRLYQMAARIPGPRGVPFFGEALSVIGNDHSKAFRSLTNLTKDFDTPSRIWYGPYCAVVLDHAKDLQVALSSKHCTDKSEVYKFIGLNKGLVVAGGDLWRTHRKLIDPSFNVNLLHSYIPIFNRKAKILTDNLEKRVGRGEADIYTQISACTLEALLETLTGLKNDIQSDADNNEYLCSMEHGTKLMNDRLYKVWYHFPFVFRFSSIYKSYQKYVVNGVFAMASDVLKQKQENEQKAINPDSKHRIFLDQLLSARNVLTDDEISDEINTMIGAGHETSSLILSAALVMLAMHESVQNKLHREVEEVSAELGDSITEAHLHKLSYCEMVIKESLRLFPVLPIHARIANDDIVLDDYTIPKGANIVISVFNAHRNVKNWGSDAEKFRPERFLPENYANIHPYAFIPFSRGPRMCIGWRYSMIFMKTTLYYLAKNFKFSTSLEYEKLTYEIALTMKIAQKYQVSLERRK